MDKPFSLSLLDSLASQPFFFAGIASIVFVLLLFSALVSGSEVAFFSFRYDQIKTFIGSEDPREKRIEQLLHHPKRLLATILILNNLINILIVTISTYATWELFSYSEQEGVIVFMLAGVVSFLIIFFGEIIPKVYAAHNSHSFARLTSALLFFFYRLFKPVSWVLMSLTHLIEQRMRKRGYSLSVEEVNQALEISVETQAVSKEEKGMLKGIVNFGTLSVKQVMQSRTEVLAFDKEMDFHELMNQINKNGHSRIPIFAETIDKIEGILYVKDLLPHIEKDETFEWQSLMRDAFFVPESKKIDDLFKDFQKKHVHIAIVIDEYGGTAGIITMEDVIEEIIGEINDEFDDQQAIAYNKLDNNTYIFEGKTSLNDFCKITATDISSFEEVKGESESLGGLLLELNAKLPSAGEKIVFNHFVFTVVAVDLRRIKRLRVYIKPENN